MNVHQLMENIAYHVTKAFLVIHLLKIWVGQINFNDRTLAVRGSRAGPFHDLAFINKDDGNPRQAEVFIEA